MTSRRFKNRARRSEVPRTTWRVKTAIFRDFHQFYANETVYLELTTQQNHHFHIFSRDQAVSHPKFSAENDYDD